MAIRLILITIAGIFCCLNTSGRGQAEKVPQKPVTEIPHSISIAPEPATVDELVSKATAVVIGRYTGNQRFFRYTPEGLVYTAYTFTISETIKWDPLLTGDRQEITLPGGDIELPTEIVRFKTEGMERLKPGNTYIIFLALNPILNKLVTLYGPGGVFDVTDGLVKSVATDRRRYDGRDAGAFVASMRSGAQR